MIEKNGDELTSLRVLYLHGIGGPGCSSFERRVHVPLLRRACGEVVAPNMRTGRLSGKHSVLRHIFKQRLLWSWAAAATAAFAGSWRSGFGLPGLAAAASAALGFAAALRKRVLQGAIDDALATSLAIARQVLLHAEVDAVVGYSWGGAVAHLLAASGDWEGPMLLVAPAIDQLVIRSPRWRGFKPPATASSGCIQTLVGDSDGRVRPGPLRSWGMQHGAPVTVVAGAGHLFGARDNECEHLLASLRLAVSAAGPVPLGGWTSKEARTRPRRPRLWEQACGTASTLSHPPPAEPRDPRLERHLL